MIYLRARFYAPEMNRFSQKDLLRGSVTQPGSLNRYAYVQNDPVNYIDPSGMRPIEGATLNERSSNSTSTGSASRSAATRNQVGPTGTTASQNAGKYIELIDGRAWLKEEVWL